MTTSREEVLNIVGIKGAITSVGYLECSTAANAAAKAIDNPGFTLSKNCRLAVKMTNANTVNAATLNINGTGTKQLFYNGERAAASNSWDAGEILDICYDGNAYQAYRIQDNDGVVNVEWETDAATTRNKVPYTRRKAGSIIRYKSPDEGWITEQYISTSSAINTGGWTLGTSWKRFIQSSDGKIETENLRMWAKPLFTYVGVNSPAARARENFINSAIKAVYIDESIIPENIKTTADGMPAIYLRQVLMNFSTNTFNINFNAFLEDGSIATAFAGVSTNDLSKNNLSNEPGTVQVVVDFKAFQKIGAIGSSVDVVYSEGEQYLLNYYKTHHEKILFREDVEKTMDDKISAETERLDIERLHSVNGENLGPKRFRRDAKVYMSNVNTGKIDKVTPNTRVAAIIPVVGGRRYKIDDTFEFGYDKAYTGYYSEYPTIQNWQDAFVRQIITKENILEVPEGAKFAVLCGAVSGDQKTQYFVEEITEKETSEVPGMSVSRDLSKYTLYTIGESLCAGGKWQEKVAELTGINFSQENNIRPGAKLSVGGTTMYGSNLEAGYWRVRHLIDQGYVTDDGSTTAVVLMNGNDGAAQFDPTAKTYKIEQIVDAGLDSAFSPSVLEGITKSLNTAITRQIVAKGKVLAISSLPTKEGDVVLYTGWAGPGVSKYTIHVVPQGSDETTREYILDKIIEINFTGVTCVRSDDGQSLVFSHGQTSDEYPLNLTFYDNVSNTGMSVEIADTDDARYSNVYVYSGDDEMTEWTDTSKWIPIPFSSAWKSSIEMLQLHYPKIRIFLGAFPSVAANKADYLLPNGLYDQVAFRQAAVVNRNNEANYQAKIDMASLYDLQIIDVLHECGIGINNFDAYYNVSNVHPKEEGYNRWGEIIAAQLLKFLA